MSTKNFEHLRNISNTDLAINLLNLGYFIETYLYKDSASSVVKSRNFLELVINDIFFNLKVAHSPNDNLVNKIFNKEFAAILPKNIYDNIHSLRKLGNAGAHLGEIKKADGTGNYISQQAAIKCLHCVRDLSIWLYINIYNGKQCLIEPFCYPKKNMKANFLNDNGLIQIPYNLKSQESLAENYLHLIKVSFFIIVFLTIIIINKN